MLNTNLNGKPMNMQLDTAAAVTLASESVAKSIPNVNITLCYMQLQDYGGNDIKVVGAMDVNVCYGQKEYKNMSAVQVEAQERSLFSSKLATTYSIGLVKDMEAVYEQRFQEEG